MAAFVTSEEKQVAASPKTTNANTVANNIGNAEIAEKDADVLTYIIPVMVKALKDFCILLCIDMFSAGSIFTKS